MKAGEDQLVQRIAKALAFKSGARLALGIGDDAALVAPTAGYATVLTCDWFLEASHFLRAKHPPDWTGCMGEAELGLRSFRRGRNASHRNSPPVKKHLYPEPRLAIGQWLAAERIATSMMDLSDGLSSDLPRLCAASRVGARIVPSKLPKVKVPGEKKLKDLDLTELALNGGDDYELLFTVRPSQARRVPRSFGAIPLSCIGEITRERRILLVRPGGREGTLSARGWDPFRHRK